MSLMEWFRGLHQPSPPVPQAPSPLDPGEKVFLPLRQHRGSVCEALVKAGDKVAMGQLIGGSQDFESAAVHASVSGTVEEIKETYDPGGQKVPTVVIRNDGADTWVDQDESKLAVLESPDQVAKTRPTRLIKRVRDAGLVQAGLLGLPLHVALSPPMAPRSYLFMTGIPVVRPIDTLIIRAVDPDPPVCPNLARLAQTGPELELGIAALARISGAEHVIIALPPGGADSPLAELARSRNWRVVTVKGTHYPYAIDGLLTRALTGRDVPTPYGEPRDVGVVIESLLTTLDVGRVLLSGRPTLERVFTVAGDVAKPAAFTVRLGTPLSRVIEAAGGLGAQAGKVILGGPMLGYAHFDLQTPVTKETDGVFVQAADKISFFENQPCIHCGRCVGSCPVGLIPAELGKLCEYRQFEQASELDLFHCIECGCCAYVCPARRPLVHLFRLGKSEVLAKRMEE